jgi:O-antigen/teichoic acid export membrane protein
MTLDAPPQPVSTMRRDLISAYAASGLKVLSWAVAAALIYRREPAAFALFALIRGTLSLLNYTTLGLAPAIIHRLSVAWQRSTPLAAPVDAPAAIGVIGYAGPATRPPVAEVFDETLRVCSSALLLSVVIGLVGALGSIALSFAPTSLNESSIGLAARLVQLLGVGLSLRLASDVHGAILQAFDRVTFDNVATIVADLIWIAFMVADFRSQRFHAINVAEGFLLSSTALVFFRVVLVGMTIGLVGLRIDRFSGRTMLGLLGFGLTVSLAQLADFLYAPTDYWLIKQLINLETIATYAPAVQIDGAMLLLVGGMAAVLLPKSAAAHVRGNVDALRVYYVRGTLASLAMLAAAGLVVWIASPWVFRLWLGDPMPATQAILPLVLIHTVVGGSSAVGRSVLLGMGKVWPFTVAALVAGVANVVLSYCFVRFVGLGLNGIVLGTICAVLGRCAIWQPWYIWRSLRSPETRDPKPETRPS